MPPTDDMVEASRKAVSWSATPDEKEQQTIEKRKYPIKYEISASLSVQVVLRETFVRFKTTDPEFLLVSKENAKFIIKTAADFDKIPKGQFKEWFPAEISNGKTFLALYAVSTMPINRLKRNSFGFYEYASRKIYISDNPFLTPNIRKIGFLIRKDPDKVNRDLFGASMHAQLASHKLSAATSEIYHEAKEALPFAGEIPNFKIKASKITHSNASGMIQTKALTIFCDKPHADFMHQLFTEFYETESNDDHYVPQKLLNGGDPQHIRAFRNAIVCQNQYLENVRVLPVIGISPKALKGMITAGDSAPQTVLSLLNKYPYFTSIEITSQSEALGKYHFMTTKAMFDQAKTFITESLPQIWAQLDNTFLDEMPESVKYPRLTTSNLKDASTTRTAALLQAMAVPDDATVASKWSKPPNTHRQPPRAISVNYSEKNFPDLTHTANSKKWKTHTADTSETTNSAAQIDTASNHSNASATSAGTTFTREDGQSLFTSLTESFMDEIKSQHAVVMETNKTLIAWMTKQAERDELIRTEQAAQAARERLLRAEQTEHNRQTDQRFFDMIKAFTAQSINDDRQGQSGIPKRHGPRRHRRTQRQPTNPSDNPNAMDTEDRSSSQDNQIRPMETDGTDKTTSNDERQHSETTSAKSESKPESQSDDSDSVWDTQGQ
jgi:hypothetical protein